jgi:hypothetical protein
MNRRPIRQLTDGHKNSIEVQVVSAAQKQIVFRHIRRDCRPGDADWPNAGNPWLGGVAPFRNITTNPLHGAHATEDAQQKITGNEILY